MFGSASLPYMKQGRDCGRSDSMCYMSTRETIREQLREDAAAADALRSRAGELLVTAVRSGSAAGLSQREIAEAVGRSQPEVSRLLRFHGRSPLGRALRRHRNEVAAALRDVGVRNPRVFGSVARGEDDEHSDVDLLVEIPEGFGLFDLTRLELKISAIVGAPVDLVPDRSLRPNLQDQVLNEAIPL